MIAITLLLGFLSVVQCYDQTCTSQYDTNDGRYRPWSCFTLTPKSLESFSYWPKKTPIPHIPHGPITDESHLKYVKEYVNQKRKERKEEAKGDDLDGLGCRKYKKDFPSRGTKCLVKMSASWNLLTKSYPFDDSETIVYYVNTTKVGRDLKVYHYTPKKINTHLCFNASKWKSELHLKFTTYFGDLANNGEWYTYELEPSQQIPAYKIPLMLYADDGGNTGEVTTYINVNNDRILVLHWHLEVPRQALACCRSRKPDAEDSKLCDKVDQDAMQQGTRLG